MKRTQQAIKHALTERWYAWEDARKVAVEDTVHRDEINLNPSDDRPAYIPKTYDVRYIAPLDRTPTKRTRMTLGKLMVTPLIIQRLRLPLSDLLTAAAMLAMGVGPAPTSPIPRQPSNSSSLVPLRWRFQSRRKRLTSQQEGQAQLFCE